MLISLGALLCKLRSSCCDCLRSQNFLLRQFSLIFSCNSDGLKILEFNAFNSFDLQSVVFELLAYPAAFFKVIKSILLANFRILLNLRSNSLWMVLEVRKFFIFNHSLMRFCFFLFLDHTQESITLHLGLLWKHFFTFLELPFTSNVQLFGKLYFAFPIGQFFSTFITLVFFKGAFLSESINFRLSVSCTFLKITKSLHFLFLFLLHFLFFMKALHFHFSLPFFMSSNSQISIFFFLCGVGLIR